MSETQDAWPPAPTGTGSHTQQKPTRSGGAVNWLAVVAGLVCGVILYAAVWRVSYRSCYPPDTSGQVLVAQLPLGLAAPLLPKFVGGLGTGLALLSLLAVLLLRRTGEFSKGLVLSVVPCALAFLFVLFLFSHMPRLP